MYLTIKLVQWAKSVHFISQIMEYSYLLVSIYKELCAQISVGRANVGIVGVTKNEHY